MQHIQYGCAPQIGILTHDCIGECIHVVLSRDMVLNLIDAMAESRQTPTLHHRRHTLLGNTKLPRFCSGYYAIVVFGHRPNLFICCHVKSIDFILPFANGEHYKTNCAQKSTLKMPKVKEYFYLLTKRQDLSVTKIPFCHTFSSNVQSCCALHISLENH